MRPVLVVSEIHEWAGSVRELLGDVSLEGPRAPLAALQLMPHGIFGGMVVDARSAPYMRTALIASYLRLQAHGSVAVLACAADVTAITAKLVRQERVEVFYEPWDGREVRRFLGLP